MDFSWPRLNYWPRKDAVPLDHLILRSLVPTWCGGDSKVNQGRVNESLITSPLIWTHVISISSYFFMYSLQSGSVGRPSSFFTFSTKQ